MKRYTKTLLAGGVAGAAAGLFYEVYKDVIEAARINQYNRWLRMIDDLDRWKEYFRWSQGWDVIIFYDPSIFKGRELTRDDWIELTSDKGFAIDLAPISDKIASLTR